MMLVRLVSRWRVSACGGSLSARNVTGTIKAQPTLHNIQRNSVMSLSLEQVTMPNADVRMLVAELEAELSATYSDEQRHGLNLERLFKPDVLFFIARRLDQPVGCGGVAFAGDLAEVKRMYVRPEHRGRRIGQAILAHLEQQARARGAARLVLETGDAQHAAIRLYERAGFSRCQAFGNYARMPEHAVRRSVFFEKPLLAVAPRSCPNA